MDLWNSASKIRVNGAMDRGVKMLTKTKTKTNWFTITVVFHVVLQFYGPVSLQSETAKRHSNREELISGSSWLLVGLGISTSS